MDLTGVSTVNSLASPSEVDDLARACAKAVQDLPLCFHEGRDFPDFLRRIELFALLKTGLRVHRLDQLSGFLDTAESLPFLAPGLLPAHLRSVHSTSLASSLPTASDRSAFAVAVCGGDENLARDVIDNESSWVLPSSYTFPLPSSGARPFRSASYLSSSAGPAFAPLTPDSAVRPHAAGSSPMSPVASPLSLGDPVVSPPVAASPSREAAFLSRLFGEPASFEGSVRSLCVLIGLSFSDGSTAPPLPSAIQDLLAPLPGVLLVRVAQLGQLSLPPLTRSSHAGWGASRRAHEVLPPLVSRVRSIFKAYAAFRSSLSPSTPPRAGVGGGARRGSSARCCRRRGSRSQHSWGG